MLRGIGGVLDVLDVRRTCVVFHPIDTCVLASGSYDKTVKVWDTARGTCASTVRDAHVQLMRCPEGFSVHHGASPSACTTGRPAGKTRLS